MPVRLRKENGELLFDTDKIVYGLVKSAYLVASDIWPRKYLKSANLDPNQGGNWENSFRQGDQMFTITVSDAKSPLVFLVGKGILQGSVTSGSTITFFYSAGSTSTKAYVFDLMSEIGGSPPWVKTRNANNEITFNSLQPALNIAAAIQAPAPGAVDQYGRYPQPYAGGTWTLIRGQSASVDSQAHFTAFVAIGGQQEYACFLPWSRAANAWLTGEMTNVGSTIYSVSEGAYGVAGGINFIFGPAGATSESFPSSNQMTIPGSLATLTTDRPQALVIATAGLPFPFR